MASKRDLPAWVLAAIDDLGAATVVQVSKWVWEHHEGELRQSGDLFFTWQYDLRWAAQTLRDQGLLAPTGRGTAARWRRA